MNNKINSKIHCWIVSQNKFKSNVAFISLVCFSFFHFLCFSTVLAGDGIEGVQLSSRFSDFRNHDEVLQGLDRKTGEWTAVPFSPAGEKLTEDEIARTLAIPRKSSYVSHLKGDLLFSEDFEVDSCPYCPSAPEYLDDGVWETYDWSYDPVNWHDGESIWGRTCSKSSNGESSVWTSKWHRDCVNPADCASYESPDWQCLDEGNLISQERIDSYLMITESISWPNQQVTALRFMSWQGLHSAPNYYDYYSVVLIDTESMMEFTLWTENNRRTSWSLCEVALPQAELIGDNFSIAFQYWIDLNGEAVEGLFLDEISITATNFDLRFQSISSNGSQESINEPVEIVVEVWNDGTDYSPPCTVAYMQNRDLPIWEIPLSDFTGSIDIPALGPGETHAATILINYEDGLWGKQSDTTTPRVKGIIYHEMHFRLDPENQAFETNEDNNNYSGIVLASWDVSKPPIILVHGYTGGGLVKNGDVVWGEDVALMAQTLLLDMNRVMRDESTDFEEDEGTMTVPSAYAPLGGEYGGGFLRNFHFNLNPYESLSTGLAFTDDYVMPQVVIEIPQAANMWDPLINTLKNGHGYIIEEDLFLFNYDWRLDMDPTNPPLNGASSSVARLDSLIQHVKASHPGGERLTVVSHSMGGLLVQTHLRHNEDNHGVYRWITLGTPFQGTVNAMSTLFGANGGLLAKIPYLGSLAGKAAGDLVQEFVSHWEMLPTPYFDENAPGVPWKWTGPEIFADIGECAFPCLGLNGSVDPQYTMQDVKNNSFGCCWGAEWYSNDNSRTHSQEFFEPYADMSQDRTIFDVDTWLFVSPNVLTLRGVAKYKVLFRDYPVYPEVNPNLLRDTAYGVIFSNGDGTVSDWSAETANVDTTNLHIRYCDNVQHRELVQDEMIANFITALTQDENINTPVFNSALPKDSSEIWNPDNDNSRTWTFEWRNQVGVWDAPNKTQQQLPVYPVTLELYDRDTGRMLIGMIQVAPPEDEPEADPVVVQAILDDRFSRLSFGNQITIASNSQEDMHLRLVIRPSPEMFIPTSQPAKSGIVTPDDEFIVAGQLLVTDASSAYLFPGPIFEDELITFRKVGMPWAAHGFQAYVDIDISGGIVLNNPNSWEMIIDSDGDGQIDYFVTEVSTETETTPVGDSFSAHPNPFNPVTRIQWAVDDENAQALTLYDISGNAVKSYSIPENSKKGSVQWNGRDATGRTVPSGVYFAVLKGSNGRQIAKTKLTLLK